jgi:hypothetical protein
MTPQVRALLASAFLITLLPAQSKPSKGPTGPDDRYVKVLAGKKLEEGKGFSEIAVVGEPLSAAKILGYGREDMDWPFWYFYDKGSWQLTLCALVDLPARKTTLHAVIVAGSGGPPTTKGLKIGDPVAKATETYGPSRPFSGALVGADRKGQTRTRIGVKTDGGTSVIDDPPEFKDALWFPDAKLLVAVDKGRVLKLAIVADEEALPDFLLPPERVAPNDTFKTDPAATVPRFDPSSKQTAFLVPPVPELAEHDGGKFTAMLPKTWKHQDDVWGNDPGVESVTIKVMQSNPQETPELVLTTINQSLGQENHVPRNKRAMPEAFCKMVNADSGYCSITVAPGRGNEGLPLRMYQLMLAKGDLRYLIIVTRTQHPQRQEMPGGGKRTTAFMGCPDGDALARGVMRSFRIKP